MKKIAIVVQRYGVDVNGGAEVHARLVAEQLAARYQVTILTSRALDYSTWEPHYPAGESVENGVSILRFDNRPRAPRKVQGFYGRKARGRHLVQKIYRRLGSPAWFQRIFPGSAITDEDGLRWLEAQGPAMPGLLDYLKKHEHDYSAFIVFTALYYPGALSVLTVPRKSIFVPTMHDEKASYIPFYKKVLASPAWIFFNTAAEQQFSEKLFPIGNVRKRIVGVGIDLLRNSRQADPSVLRQFGIRGDYLVYVGRIDKAKGCDVLIDHFTRLVRETQLPLQLVLIGKEVMTVAPHPSIITTSFVSDAVKEQLMLQATALSIPSLYESLSLVLLESFGCGVPVLANGDTEVLRDHIQASNGGWCFTNYETFKAAMLEAIDPGIARQKGENGFAYVKNSYSWETVLTQFDEAIETIEREIS
jgi:glycosyltransferase involved in cell wall biosynthesis